MAGWLIVAFYDVRGGSTLGCRSLAAQLQNRAGLSTAGIARSS